MKPVWIIDDDRSIRWVLEKSLTRENIDFNSFAAADDALRAWNSGGRAVEPHGIVDLDRGRVQLGTFCAITHGASDGLAHDSRGRVVHLRFLVRQDKLN